MKSVFDINLADRRLVWRSGPVSVASSHLLVPQCGHDRKEAGPWSSCASCPILCYINARIIAKGPYRNYEEQLTVCCR